MSILDGFKTCRKGLHQYPADLKQCPECQKISHQLWYQQNAEQSLENNRRWREKNPDRKREIGRRWRERNRERNRELKRLWYAQNQEKHREFDQRWRDKNPGKIRAIHSRRRANKKQAAPPWADHSAINAIYAEAVRLEQKTGIKHHVDHIYPLQSDYMCGLHVAENLQILPGKENLSKSNRIWPGQLDCQRLPLHMNGFEVTS